MAKDQNGKVENSLRSFSDCINKQFEEKRKIRVYFNSKEKIFDESIKLPDEVFEIIKVVNDFENTKRRLFNCDFIKDEEEVDEYIKFCGTLRDEILKKITEFKG